MGNISKDFNRKEFACPCCGKDNINHKLVETVQAIRDTVGAPVIINSGVRCDKHNKAVGGVGNSSHLTGYAADIRTEGRSNFMEISISLESCCGKRLRLPKAI